MGSASPLPVVLLVAPHGVARRDLEVELRRAGYSVEPLDDSAAAVERLAGDGRSVAAVLVARGSLAEELIDHVRAADEGRRVPIILLPTTTTGVVARLLETVAALSRE